MEIQYGNQIAYLDAQTRLVEQQNERLVQQRKLVEIAAARQALEEQIEQTKAGYEHQVLNDLSDAEKKVAELSQDLIKAERKTEEQVLRSPIDGTVQQLAVHTVGGVVTPAQQLMVIVPADSRLEVEAMISNRDIGFVSVGQQAEVKIDTFNFTRYGLLQGKVVSVSQDAIVRDEPNKKPADKKLGGALLGYQRTRRTGAALFDAGLARRNADADRREDGQSCARHGHDSGDSRQGNDG